MANEPISLAMPNPNTPAPKESPQVTAPDVPPTMPAAPPPSEIAGPRPQPVAPPGSFFTNLGHAFMGSVLGSLAEKQETVGYSTDPDTGVTSPIRRDLHPRDQLARIAENALRGLAAGATQQPRASGAADAAAGIGAGFGAVDENKQQQDLLQRKQASDQFEQQQQATLNKLNNAHILMENIKLHQDLMNADLTSNQKMADIGADTLDAAVSGGNKIVGERDMSSSDVAQFRKDHPEYLNYTPLLTKAEPAVNDDGTPVVDPATGVQKINRKYSFVDLKSPVELNQSMIDHLNQVGFPGADKLTAGQKVDPKQFQALYWNGLKAYNEAMRDPKNSDIVDTSDAQGNPTKVMINKVTKTVTPLIDPETHQPLTGKVETEKTDIYDPASGKISEWIINSKNGKHIAYVGEKKPDASSFMNSIGDFSKTGEDYLKTVPQSMQGVIKTVANYGLKPADLGRAQNRMQILAGVTQYSPSFNEQNYQERFNYMNDYQSANKGDGLQRASANTAIGHLSQLDEAGKALAQNDIQTLNRIANSFQLETGRDAPAIYDSIAYKAAGEAARAVQGGVPNQVETDKLYAQLGHQNSPGQRAGVIHAQLGLIMTPLTNMRTRFTENMGQTPESMGRPVVNPQNEEILKKYGMSSTPPAAQAPQSGQAAPVQSNKPAPGPAEAKAASTVKRWAIGPDGQHRVYTVDGTTWLDSQTGEPLPKVGAESVK